MPSSHDLIAEGKVGCIILAGGDATRLRYTGPKGLFRLPKVGKTLFDILLEKIDPALPLAVMTSPTNHKATKEALPDWIDCFTQHTLPLLAPDRKPLPIQKPNGNGEVFAAFAESGLLQKWQKRGVEFIQVIPVDNPLAKPFDPDQIQIHIQSKADVTIKGVKRLSPDEKIGFIGIKEGKVCVIEYTDTPPTTWELGNTGLLSFSLSFIEKIKDVSLPIHLVKRRYDGQEVYKQETFIFDLLPYSNKTEVIEVLREEAFAPLKSLEDLDAVERAIQAII